MTDLTRKSNFSQKKGVCVASARITHDMVADTALNTLFNLPENAVISNSYVVVEVAGQASLTVDFGFAGGDELGDGLALDVTAGTVVSTPLVVASSAAAQVLLHTGTGKAVSAKFSSDPSAGTFVFVVEFTEYDLATGSLMDITRA